MMNDRKLGEILSELVAERGLTLDKLSGLTNIPKRYLSAMAENDEKNMPASPYIKGYITKISSTLEIDPLPLFEAYKKTSIQISGKVDNLPTNRFALTKKKAIWIIIVALAALAIIIGLLFIGKRYFFAEFMGIPLIEVNIPANKDILETRNQFFTIKGRINPRDSIIINEEPTSVSADGAFSKEVLLEPGINTFEIKVKRFLGKETTITRTIVYMAENLNEEINNININNGEEIIQEEQIL